jgi:hypothetical protein
MLPTHAVDSVSGLGQGERMTNSTEQRDRTEMLRLAIVVSADEETCGIAEQDQLITVSYAAFFPRPRADRVAPGHLVALATAPNGSEVVVWRWFDAVVVGTVKGRVRLWEPGHGEVLADARNPQRSYRLGSRAYLSAGLEGADWWVAGVAVGSAGDAEVDIEEVESFLTTHALVDRLA